MTRQRTRPSPVWKIVVGIALFVTLGVLTSLLLKAATSPSPLNLLSAEVGFFVFLGVIAYFRLGTLDIEPSDEKIRKGTRRTLVLAFGTAYVVTVTVAALLLWQSIYVPSPLYYIALSLAAALIALEIIYWTEISKRSTTLVLLQIIIIGTLIQISFPWLNPKSVFSDMYFHWLGIGTIVQFGAIPEALGYIFYFPSFHIFNATGVEIVTVGFGSFILFNHLLMILAIPSSYLLARHIVPPRHALASALLLTFSLFFFLHSFAVPLLLGINIMILSLYALLQYQKKGDRKWWGIFWLLAIFVFFSHPVNSLVFAAILAVFWFNSRLRATPQESRKLTAPAVTYGVGYSAYLVFISVSAFEIFVQAMFESGPRIYSARPPGGSGSVPGIFVAQVTMSTMGFAILFLPAMIAILSWLFEGSRNRRFIVGAIIVVASVPTLMVLLGKGPYGLQATRALPYLSIFLVFPAASGLLYLTEGRHRARFKLAMGYIFVLVLALLSSISYLTVSGNRFLSDSIPVHTTYLTDSTLQVRGFLDRIPDTTPLAMDPVMADFLAPYQSGVAYPVTPYPINHQTLVGFSEGFGNASVALALSSVYLIQSGYGAPDVSRLDYVYGIRAYDSGIVRLHLSSDK